MQTLTYTEYNLGSKYLNYNVKNYRDYYVISNELVEYFIKIPNKLVIYGNCNTIEYLNFILKDKKIENLHIISHAGSNFVGQVRVYSKDLRNISD